MAALSLSMGGGKQAHCWLNSITHDTFVCCWEEKCRRSLAVTAITAEQLHAWLYLRGPNTHSLQIFVFLQQILHALTSDCRDLHNASPAEEHYPI